MSRQRRSPRNAASSIRELADRLAEAFAEQIHERVRRGRPHRDLFECRLGTGD